MNWLRRLPATTVYVGLLLATAGWMASQSVREQARFIRHNSSNVHHLEVGKWWTLLTSGLVVDGVPVLLGIAAVAGVLGLAEWRWGTLRGFGVFLFGHVTATLLTEGAMWLMKLAHLPGALSRARDVGISYGLVATAACLLALGGHRARRYGLPALTLLLTVAWAVDQELADAGHVVALGLGVLGARSPWLRSRRRVRARPSGARGAPPRNLGDGAPALRPEALGRGEDRCCTSSDSSASAW
ncbi:rhomboid-like protein [Streptomyces sp. UNOC14_S4]|uniref:rhomboid-like protein n=1 Tax=Streptomyces sp. UNOC14_S4 TaxID=2872340 RepID=UPI001E5C19C1|nr:rhomboid-like protein [Streptomyces sp. UNOC14_S4]